MNRLNPIYILALVITVFIISVFILDEKKDEYKKSNSNFNSLNVKAKEFNEYKNSWFNEDVVEKKLDSILKSSSFRKEKILTTKDKNVIRVKIESNNQKVLDRFLNRILNERFIFKKVNIQKRYISFEIGLK